MGCKPITSGKNGKPWRLRPETTSRKHNRDGHANTLYRAAWPLRKSALAERAKTMTYEQRVKEIVKGYDKDKRLAFADFVTEIVCKNHGFPLDIQKQRFAEYIVQKKIPSDVIDDFIDRALLLMQLAREETA